MQIGGSTPPVAPQTSQMDFNDVARGTQSAASPAKKEKDEVVNGERLGDVWKQFQSQFGEKAAPQRSPKKTLGKDDFMNIMVAQMKNQDPTKPVNAEQMAQQMAQYASVEQLQNVNQNIQKLALGNQPLERMAMTGMIGKVVTVDRERFQHTEGGTSSIGFQLAKDAKSVKVSVVDQAGEVVVTRDLGAQKTGNVTFNWDGLKANTMPAPTAGYMIRVEARDENDVAIQSSPKSQVPIVGVSFEGAEPVFLIGDAKNPDKITMKNVVRIETEGALPASNAVAPAAIPGAKSLSEAAKRNAPQAPAAAAQAPQGAAKAAEPSAPNAPSSKDIAALMQQAMAGQPGFPNGLNADTATTSQGGGTSE